jgi:hypothetical protein
MDLFHCDIVIISQFVNTYFSSGKPIANPDSGKSFSTLSFDLLRFYTPLLKKVKQSRYRPGVVRRVPGS